MAATPSRPATRAIALLTPDAMPAVRSSASASTVAVSGATVAARPEGEHEQRRQQVGPVVEPRLQPGEEREPGRADDRAEAHEPARAVPVGERTGPLGEQEHDDRRRHRRQARLERVVAAHLLEEEHQEEEDDRQAAVHREGLEVPHREVAPPEQAQREHRMGGARLVGDEGDQQHHARRRAGSTRPAPPTPTAAGGSARAPARPARARRARPRASRSAGVHRPPGAPGTAMAMTPRVTSTNGTLIAKIHRHEVTSIR